MNNIRFADQEDHNQIQSLWKLCFPDDGRFDAWFFKYVFSYDHTLLYCVNHTICSMLQVYPYQLTINNKNYPVQYVYGVCTHPDYRHKGMMADLMDFSFQLGKLRGNFASILIPQEETLFALYEKFGYRKGFYASLIDVVSNDASDQTQIKAAREQDIPSLASIYEQSVMNYNGVIIRDKTYWKKQIHLFTATGGKVFLLKNDGRSMAYAFVGLNGGIPFIQEGCGVDVQAIRTLGQKLSCLYKQPKISTIVPPHLALEQTYPIGCIKFFTTKNIPNLWGYMNLMFN